jgi:3-dehydroquinate dehydratase
LYTPNSGGTALGHNANRSVFYYKGLTYVGGCFGFVDTHSRQVQGTCNASSNESVTQQTLSQNTGGLINASQAATTSQNLVINTAGFVLNVGWTGKITTTRPNMRFRGKGELSVVSPAGESSLQTLAYQAYSGLIDAIIQSTSNLQNADAAPVDFTSASDAIQDALQDLSTYLGTGGGPNEVFADAVTEPVRVTGNRRFF